MTLTRKRFATLNSICIVLANSDLVRDNFVNLKIIAENKFEPVARFCDLDGQVHQFEERAGSSFEGEERLDMRCKQMEHVAWSMEQQ